MTDTQMTRDEMLAEFRTQTLRDIDSTAKSLKHALLEVRLDADRAIEALNKGNRVAGMSLGTGPLGHQGPADIVKITSRLETLLNQANMLGIDPADIQTAYARV